MRHIVILFSLISLFFSCQKKEETIKVGTSLVLSSAGLFLAQEYGFFKERGLEVELIPFQQSGAPMTVLLDSGELDVGGGNLTAGLFQSISDNNSSRIVADKGSLAENARYISLVARRDFVAQDGDFLTALKNKKIGVTSLAGVSQAIALDKVISSVGLEISDVQFVKLSYPNMNIAIGNGEIDAAVQIEPYVSYGVEEGMIQVIASVQDFYPNQQSAAIVYSGDFQKKEVQSVKFMEAYLLGVRKYNDAFFKNINKDEVVEKLKKYIKLKENFSWDQVTPVGINPNGLLNEDYIKEDVKWYIDQSFLKNTKEDQEYINPKIVSKALETIGKYE